MNGNSVKLSPVLEWFQTALFVGAILLMLAYTAFNFDLIVLEGGVAPFDLLMGTLMACFFGVCLIDLYRCLRSQSAAASDRPST